MASYHHFKTIESTSLYLKNNYHKYDNLTFLSTDYQTNGHGRLNREWFSSEKENLLFSVLIKDRSLIDNFASLSLLSAFCIVNVLEKLKIKNVSIKWPNDIYINDKKIAGILLESVSYSNSIEALVVGIGLNVNCKNFPSSLLNKATSIYLERQKRTNIYFLRHKVYKEFNKIIKQINSINYIKTINEKYNYLKDKEVYVKINNKKEYVKVICINEDNSLKVKKDDEITNLYSGEVTFDCTID